jgi:hypothetical protein
MKKVVLILFGTSVALGATTLHLVRELRNERAAGLQLKTRIAELERAKADVQPLAAPSPETSRPNPWSAPVVVTAAPKPAAGQPAVAAGGFAVNVTKEERVRMMRESMERQRALLRDPAYREAMRVQQKAMLPSMYPDLAEEMDLTPEQLDQFLSLLADQQVRAMERDRPFFEGPPDPATIQDMARAQQEQQTAMDNEVRDFLGEDKWSAWNEYRSSMGVRHEVSQMRSTLAMKGAPLEDQQVKPLQRALVEAQQRQIEDWNRNGPHMVGPYGEANADQQLALQQQMLKRQREHYERLRESLKSVLTDAQLRHVEEQQEAQMKVQEAHLVMMRAQAEAEASGQIAPAIAVGSEAAIMTNGAVLVQPTPASPR